MIVWENYQTAKFKPRLVNKTFDPRGSCGVYALGYLTGINIAEIDRHTPKSGWWGDADMLRFLEKRGYECIELTPEALHARKVLPATYTDSSGVLKANPSYYERHPNHLNVMLISQHTMDEEGSWAVAYNHRYYHGVEVEFFTGYELLVNPFWTGYAIWHEKWKTPEKARKRALSLNFVGRTNLEEKIEMFNPLSAEWYNLPLTVAPKGSKKEK
jgi:hypothetical protein